MREQSYDGLSLFGLSGSRKYLNAAERLRFIEAARLAPPAIRLFCLTLGWSGARISEVLALTPASIDIESGVASIQTLMRLCARLQFTAMSSAPTNALLPRACGQASVR